MARKKAAAQPPDSQSKGFVRHYNHFTGFKDGKTHRSIVMYTENEPVKWHVDFETYQMTPDGAFSNVRREVFDTKDDALHAAQQFAKPVAEGD